MQKQESRALNTSASRIASLTGPVWSYPPPKTCLGSDGAGESAGPHPSSHQYVKARAFVNAQHRLDSKYAPVQGKNTVQVAAGPNLLQSIHPSEVRKTTSGTSLRKFQEEDKGCEMSVQVTMLC